MSHPLSLFHQQSRAGVDRFSSVAAWLAEFLRVAREGSANLYAWMEYVKKECPFQWMKQEFQQQLVEKVMNDPVMNEYPPQRHHYTTFWYIVLQQIHEASKQSADKDIQLLPELQKKWEKVQAEEAENKEETLFSGWYKTFVAPACHSKSPSLDSPVQFTCRVETGCLANIGFVLWPAGFLLAEFILHRKELFQGKVVLELGTGIGLTCLYLPLVGAKRVIASDYEERILENIALNFALNGHSPSIPHACSEGTQKFISSLQTVIQSHSADKLPQEVDMHGEKIKVPSPFSLSKPSSSSSSPSSPSSSSNPTTEMQCCLIDWYHFDEDLIKSLKPDVIIAADTTYLPEILAPFAKVVRACLAANPDAVLYSAQAERHPSTLMQLADAFRDEDLKIKDLPTESIPPLFVYDRNTCPVILQEVRLRK